MGSQVFDYAITSLCMTSDTFLVIGLQNGSFMGWNLSQNTFDGIPAHSQAVTAMYKHLNFLVSGDAAGEIKIRDCENYAVQLEGRVIPDSNPKGLAAAVTQV